MFLLVIIKHFTLELIVKKWRAKQHSNKKLNMHIAKSKVRLKTVFYRLWQWMLRRLRTNNRWKNFPTKFFGSHAHSPFSKTLCENEKKIAISFEKCCAPFFSRKKENLNDFQEVEICIFRSFHYALLWTIFIQRKCRVSKKKDEMNLLLCKILFIKTSSSFIFMKTRKN